MKISIVITEAKTTVSFLRTICQVLYLVLSSSLVYSKLRGIKQALLKLTLPFNYFPPKFCPVLPSSSPPSSHHLQKTKSHPYQQVEAWSSNSTFPLKILSRKHFCRQSQDGWYWSLRQRTWQQPK